jgi:hypothetical protein
LHGSYAQIEIYILSEVGDVYVNPSTYFFDLIVGKAVRLAVSFFGFFALAVFTFLIGLLNFLQS